MNRQAVLFTHRPRSLFAPRIEMGPSAAAQYRIRQYMLSFWDVVERRVAVRFQRKRRDVYQTARSRKPRAISDRRRMWGFAAIMLGVLDTFPSCDP